MYQHYTHVQTEWINIRGNAVERSTISVYIIYDLDE